MQVSSNAANRYVADINLTGFGNDLRVNGTLSPQGNDVAMNLDLAIRRLQLNTFEGALATFVTRASGGVNGNVSINGTMSAPKVQGTINFDSVSVNTIAVGGPLSIHNESLTVTEKGFDFNQFTIRDSANSPLNLNGTVRTANFINYNFNLKVDAENFRVVNTTKKVNSLYYGEMYINTNLNITGTERNPSVDGNLTVNEGTNFSIVIPQADAGVVQREGVVEFVDFSNPGVDSLFLAYDSLNNADILGFNIAANISIVREANFNVIVDVANGDFLNLKGVGELTAGIDPSGKVTLTGTYTIDEGAYQFSFNFLRRRFEVEKGSTITWFGEPTNAELDVTAKYIANTAPLDLVQNQITDVSQRNYYLQKLPFHVFLNLNGELLKPVLTFDITLPEEQNYTVSGDVVSTVRTRLTQLRQEPSELNKQVFSILLLNRFVGENPFESSSGGFSAGAFARQSVSKLLTEELNDLASGLINGVDINFDLASSDDYTTGDRRNRTDLNVGLSKRLLNDRLTVTVGNNFQLEGPTPANNQGSNVAGNISINYQLSKDGRYMLRFYRRNEYEAAVEGYVIETGLGFILTVDYNRFREVIHGRRMRKAARVENQNNEQK
jgi:autotransporter translocation and assembly factor TamB